MTSELTTSQKMERRSSKIIVLEENERIEAEKKELALKTEKLGLVKKKDFSPITMKRDTLRAFQYLKKMQAIEKWMSEILKEEIQHSPEGSHSEEFTNYLRNGVPLCNLVNKIKPGIIKRFNQEVDFAKKAHHFRAMENIWFFLEACTKIGVHPKQDLFVPTDLFESKNIGKVVDCMISLGQVASEKFPTVPKFSLHNVSEQDFSRTEIESVSDRLDDKDEEFESDPSLPSSQLSIKQTKVGRATNSINSSYPLASSQITRSVSGPNMSSQRSSSSPSLHSEEKPSVRTTEEFEVKLEQKVKSTSSLSKEPVAEPQSKESLILDSADDLPIEKIEALSRKTSKKQLNYAEIAKMRKNSKAKKKWNADEIMQGLYLGDMIAAANREELQKRNITHILSLIEGKPLYDDLKYLIINAYDSSDHDMISHFPITSKFISEGRSSGGILVHCQKGVSRSATVVIAYMMSNLGYHFYDAADYVCEKRPVICPNLGFIKQLQLYEQMKFQFEGTSEAHVQYQRLRIKSLLMDEKTRWEENTENYSDPGGDKIKYFTENYHLCKNCKHKLLNKELEIVHEQEENWDDEEVECDLMFTLPLSWMGELKLQKGEIKCPGCSTIVGRWDWQGSPCSCGFLGRPCFGFLKNQLE